MVDNLRKKEDKRRKKDEEKEEVEKKGEEKNKEKKRKKEQIMAKEDIVFVFGRKEDNPKLFFGFKENYSAPRSKVGRKALRDAVYLIFDNTLNDPGCCQGAIFTLVLMCCEAARFEPIYFYFKLVNDEDYEVWVGHLVQNWARLTRLARRTTHEHTSVVLGD
ncbi:hypothetical protein Tco_0112581 [Tanacetum coccineum]